MSSPPAEVVASPEPVRRHAPGLPETPPPDLGLPTKSSNRLPFILAAVVIFLVVAIFFGLKFRHTPVLRSGAVLNHPAAGQTLRLKGTTEAVQSQSIVAPVLAGQQVSTLTITRLAPAGTHVKKGDILAEFDRQAQMRDSIDKRADYEKLASQVIEEQSKEAAAKAKDETELKQAENALSKAELEIQKAEIVSKIDAEKNQETLDEAKATNAQLHDTFDLKRKAAQSAIRILEIQRDRTRDTMVHAQANAELMQIRAPIDGVVVLNTIEKDGTIGEVQEGDQIRPGMTFMQVVDPSAMQVRVQANQEDFFSLHTGQNAKVQLDAYPEMSFNATLDELAPIAQNGGFSNKLRTFVVIFTVKGNDPKLMPDLSAAVDVDVSQSGGDRSDT